MTRHTVGQSATVAARAVAMWPATGVSEGTRTPDTLDHNQVLYQLSYTHHAK